jgi:hypothetical protein
MRLRLDFRGAAVRRSLSLSLSLSLEPDELAAGQDRLPPVVHKQANPSGL